MAIGVHDLLHLAPERFHLVTRGFWLLLLLLLLLLPSFFFGSCLFLIIFFLLTFLFFSARLSCGVSFSDFCRLHGVSLFLCFLSCFPAGLGCVLVTILPQIWKLVQCITVCLLLLFGESLMAIGVHDLL